MDLSDMGIQPTQIVQGGSPAGWAGFSSLVFQVSLQDGVPPVMFVGL